MAAAISRTAITAPPHDPDLPQVLPYQFVNNENDGCIGLDFPDELVFIGSNLNNDHIFAHRLVPLIESMSRLDVGRLVPVFEALLPILQVQTELHRTIVEHAKPIVEPKTRWAAHISVSNYGSAPFLLFPKMGWIIVEASDMQPFCLPTKLVLAQDNQGHEDVVGTHLVESGKTDRFMLLTTATQSEIPRGDRLRALWKSGDGNGRVRLHVRGRELPFSLWAKSSQVPFKE